MSADQSTGDVTMSAEQFAALQEQVAALVARVDELEGQVAGLTQSGEADPDVVLAISAAVAAYLGKRATVRQVRLRRGSSWSAQGRTVQQQSHFVSTRGSR